MSDESSNELEVLLRDDPIGTLHRKARELSKQAAPDRQTAVYKEVINIPQLKEEWEELRRKLSIEAIDVNTFPENYRESILVLYCDEHCLFCHVVKPTFANLSRFLTKTRIYYSDNKELKKREGVTLTPLLMAYLPDGRKAGLFPGNTTQMLWDMMNLLPHFAEQPTGKNVTEGCEGETCIIR